MYLSVTHVSQGAVECIPDFVLPSRRILFTMSIVGVPMDTHSIWFTSAVKIKDSSANFPHMGECDLFEVTVGRQGFEKIEVLQTCRSGHARVLAFFNLTEVLKCS